MKFLLQYKNVNLDVRDEKGRNLRNNAVRLQCEKCIRSILDVGLSVTAEDEDGVSAFNFAAEKCFNTVPLVALLMRATRSGVGRSPVTALDLGALYKNPVVANLFAENTRRFLWPLDGH